MKTAALLGKRSLFMLSGSNFNVQYIKYSNQRQSAEERVFIQQFGVGQQGAPLSADTFLFKFILQAVFLLLGFS